MSAKCESVLSRSELQDLRDAFALFDTEKKGVLAVRELKSVLQELNTEENASSSTLQRLHALLSSLPEGEDSFLSLDDFIQLMTTPNPSDSRDEMQKVFELFDEDKKGYIDAQDLRKVAQDLGETLNNDELGEMVHRVSQDGKVTIEQFRDIMNKKLF